MGYETRFELEITPNNSKLTEVIEWRSVRDLPYKEVARSRDSFTYSIDELESLYTDLSSTIDFECIAEAYNGSIQCKWYSHEDHMRKLSKVFPDALFTLTGHGEDEEDIWREFYKDGKMHRVKAEITFPKFNEKALK